MARNSEYHTGFEGSQGPYRLTVHLSPDDRALLVRLSHERRQSASEVIRALLRESSTGDGQ